jgi:hypothetical protein
MTTISPRDIYIKVKHPNGSSHVSAHRVWDGSRFIAAMHNEGQKAEKPEDRFSVSEATKSDYQLQRGA